MHLLSSSSHKDLKGINERHYISSLPGGPFRAVGETSRDEPACLVPVGVFIQQIKALRPAALWALEPINEVNPGSPALSPSVRCLHFITFLLCLEGARDRSNQLRMN